MQQYDNVPEVAIHPFILSGGAGTRLWPESRVGLAKQLTPVMGEQTLLQQTVKRIEALDGFGPATLIGASNDKFILRDQLSAIESDAYIIAEPARRDTLAAVVLAAEVAAQRDRDAIVAVIPSDHLMGGDTDFGAAVRRAASAVAESGIAVIGVTPTGPSTAYGYILPSDADAGGAQKVARFVEKPDAQSAEELFQDGGYLWNAGIFCFRAGWLIEAVREMHPAVVSNISRSVCDGVTDGGVFTPSAAFEAVEPISFDHGFMEHTDAAVVVSAEFNLSDVGDWNAVWTMSEKDKDGVASKGDVVNLRSKNTLVHASHRMVCTVGVSDIAVIETPDAVLVVSLKEAQGVKELVKHLESQNRPEALEHLRNYRPWGWYQTVDLGERFRVKRICVKPGAKLSLQRHQHRAEHWTVVRGTAETTIGNEVSLLTENESVYVPLGTIHRLRNPGKIPLELVEVQTGGYLEEDDIERIEDDFGRVVDFNDAPLIAAE